MNTLILKLFHITFILTVVSSLAVDTKFTTTFETGFLSVLYHKIQLSSNGTYFDYKENGGQDVLFPVQRYSLELEVNKKHTFILLYQPLRIESQEFLKDDLVVDFQTFPDSSAVNFLYNFPFYRFSYCTRITPVKSDLNFAVGFSLQIRNATISFESTDGEIFRTNRDIGLVPALKIRSRYIPDKKFFFVFEADGIYAPISYLNGSSNEVKGAILDAVFQSGLKISKPGSVSLNLRYITGGATGTSTEDTFPGDGYVKNWLHFLIPSVSFSYIF